MAQTKTRKTADGAHAAPRQNRMAVLVLDDEPTVRGVLCRFLHEHGYQSVGATSVTEAVKLLDTTPVGAVILDVRLSGGRSGLEVLTTLRRQAALKTTPAIVMTGVAPSDEEQALITKHHASLFYKPAGLTSLIGFLEKITERGQPR